MWTGINGKSFRGTFHHLSEGGVKAEFLATDGRILTVALSNLIPTDRERILNPLKPSSNPAAPGDSNGFKPVTSPDRKLMPGLDPKVFGGTTDESLVDAMWISLLWWDQTGVLAVPARGDLKDKAEWLHKKLLRSVAAGVGNVSAEDAQKGVERYFSEELEKVASCRINLEAHEFTATRLAGFLQGANAVVLRMSMKYANGRDYSVSTVLESMSEDGKFVFHVFGRRFSGFLKPMEDGKAGTPGSVPFEYVLDRPGDLPDYYAQNEARFFMGKESWNAAIVLKPYVYLEPGKPVPLPAEEERPIPAE